MGSEPLKTLVNRGGREKQDMGEELAQDLCTH